MFCRTCWANIPDDTTQCPKCGVDPRLAADPDNPGTPGARPARSAPPRTTGKKTSSPFSFILIVVMTAGAALYLLAPNEPSQIKTPAPLIESNTSAPPLPAAHTPIEPGPQPDLAIEDGESREPQKSLAPAIDAFRRAQYLKASVLLKKTLMDFPDSAKAQELLSRTLNKIGLVKYRSGDYEDAKASFSEAADIKADPVSYINLAAAHMALGETIEAAAALEPVSADPRAGTMLRDLYVRLAERDYAGGKVDEALERLNSALALDPSNASIQTRIQRIQQEHGAEEGFGNKVGVHFWIKYDGGENARTGHIISILLEEAYIKVGAELNRYPEDKIGAVLYTQDAFRDITQSPSWAGAVYDGRIKIPVGGITRKTELLRKALYHEYTHALVHRLARGRAPTWLNEGLAQYQEGKRTRAEKAALRTFAEKGGFTLRSIEGSFMNLNAKEARTAYLLSLSATEYIVREFGVSATVRILEDIGEGKSVDKAISSALYLPYEELNQGWLRSIAR